MSSLRKSLIDRLESLFRSGPGGRFTLALCRSLIDPAAIGRPRMMGNFLG